MKVKWKRYCLKNTFSTCTNLINIVLLPPKICIIIVFNFSRDVKMSQEKSKTMSMQVFGGKRSVLWDLCKKRINRLWSTSKGIPKFLAFLNFLSLEIHCTIYPILFFQSLKTVFQLQVQFRSVDRRAYVGNCHNATVTLTGILGNCQRPGPKRKAT